MALNEEEIGKRLREFRESKRIPRTAFAVALGIGGERLASYEAGRTPLRYHVFRLISEKFKINPYWLATGEGAPESPGSIDDSSFSSGVAPRALFSDVYRRFLAPEEARLRQQTQQIATQLREVMQAIQKDPEFKASPYLPQAVTHLQDAIENLKAYVSRPEKKKRR